MATGAAVFFGHPSIRLTLGKCLTMERDVSRPLAVIPVTSGCLLYHSELVLKTHSNLTLEFGSAMTSQDTLTSSPVATPYTLCWSG